MPKAKKIKVVTKRTNFVPLLAIALVLSLSVLAYIRWLRVDSVQKSAAKPVPEVVNIAPPTSLPKPVLVGKMSIESALQSRRSRRDFTPDNLNLKQVGQMLWSAQGVTTDWGGRTAPSAKSAYPLTIYLVANRVIDLSPGVYQYIPGEREAIHQIQLIKSGDLAEAVGAAVGQNAAKNPPALIVITGNMDKMAKAFDNKRNDNNVYLEAGHAAENLYLQAESLGLGMVTIAGFDEAKVTEVLNLPSSETIIYAIPFGIPKP